MDVHVLGRFHVLGAHGDGVPAARKPRQVLALLVLGAGHPVSPAALLAELWDGHPPRSAAATLQTYVLQLRKALARACGRPPRQIARRVLVTEYGGYRFETGEGSCDLDGFTRLERLAHSAEQAADHALAVRTGRAALALCEGPLFGDVEQGRLLRAAAEQFDARRHIVQLRCLAGEMALGRHRDAVGELAALAVARPCDEELCVLLMTALHHCGRRYDALAAFARLRTAMATELGVAPGPVIRRLYRAVRAGDAIPVRPPANATVPRADFEPGPADFPTKAGATQCVVPLAQGGHPQ
ncbi:AfsR/SARP family transcriptional regulator [Streptomyces sp. VRA16 Mangrove soil]|uniref:AfsR/SARP family transcriptional regulator n=1 Tax=Streptomyces sp. VRA16 Mangrove soil TaxID=2817434 RepID=UPI001A9E1422|nr:AfsR/SARP family transcriptional regulator [Streptomyces sp. VRA16 Mangrove soil]MBO1332637.1 AfsR/SARP family transcriptional regulator [Streptomyces sp. VRA16 Mangrove soil]